MKRIIILFIAATALLSCSKDDDKNISEINIRLSNASQFHFQNIIVNTGTGKVNFENISSGQKTKYKTFQSAYRYAFVELQIDGKTYILQPIDYVGEAVLKKGNYTYQLDANDSEDEFGQLSLKLIEE